MLMNARIRTRIRRAIRGEDGVTLIVVLGVMMVAMLTVGALVTATGGDARSSRRDLDLRKAYYAAQAGLNEYLYQLNQNPDFWEECSSETTAGYSSGQTVPVPNSTVGDESYSYTPIPANGYNACDPNDPDDTMIQANTGTFRILVNGFSGGSSSASTTGGKPVVRSFVVTFSRPTLLKYAYFTEYETSDPILGQSASCAAIYGVRPSSCDKIDWISADTVSGPMFSDDYFWVCGTPTFGRSPSDTISTPGIYYESGCTGTANVNQANASNPVGTEGTLDTNAGVLTVPASNGELLHLAQLKGTVLTGSTFITLTGNTMTVTNGGTTTTGVAFPSNGVLYVQSSSSGCPVTYSPYGPNYSAYNYGGSYAGCGTVFVQGNYTKSLTIASDSDIVVNGNITTPTDGSGKPTTNSLLGLVPQNFVRVYHPLNGSRGTTNGNCGTASNSGTAVSVIYAAILTTADSFIADNYDCGSPLGTLEIYGALAQVFRGTVGTHSGNSLASGYNKDYVYDDRLSVQQPPHFLSPNQTAWNVQSEAHCSMSYSARGTLPTGSTSPCT
jgi:hypothetical protein